MIYFDNAATTFPKPPFVNEEVYRCMKDYCGNPGRSSHRLSMKAAEKVFDCRQKAADFFGLSDPTKVIFTKNTTEALNIAIKGLLHVGDHVLISDIEHNAVYRPIWHLANFALIQFDIYPSSGGNENVIEGIKSRIKSNTSMIVAIHSSNICSKQLPIKEIGAICRERNIKFVVDAAGSAGHLPINMAEMSIDALCVPGHKGLYGPQGSGMLLLGNDTYPETVFEGGNGINSLDPDMSDTLPERYEAGTLSTPAIAGLYEGIRTVERIGIDEIHKSEKILFNEMLSRLSEMKNVTVYAPEYSGGILLFNVDGLSPDEVGSRLNDVGICVRSGYHCAPLAHSMLGTPDGGAVRVSFGIYNTKKEVISFCDNLLRIANN